MKKRANGEGTVYRAGARWEGQLSLPDGKRKKVRGATQAEVTRKMNHLRREASAGVDLGVGRTVGMVLDYFVAKTLPNRGLAPASSDAYGHMVNPLRAEFGRIRLDALHVQRVDEGLERLAVGTYGRPLSKRTLKYARGTFAQALDVAVRNRWMSYNPARLAELPTITATPQDERRSLTPDEADRLWRALADERLGNLFRLMLTTGLRPGEATGLCWDAVDLDSGVCRVERVVRRDGGRAVIADKTKNAKSHRTFRLPAPAVEVLRAQHRQVAQMKLAARAWARAGHDLVFPTATGTPWNPVNVRQELAAICDRVGIVPTIRPHELRHSAASILADAGVPLEAIANLLGHADTRMLTQVYRHHLRPIDGGHVEVMDRLFGD